MAGIIGRTRDIQVNVRAFSPPPSWIWINDGFVPATSGGMGIIQAVGIIPVGSSVAEVPGTDTKLFLVHATNGTVSFYEVLATTPTIGSMPTHTCTAQTTDSCDVEQWATNAGTMDGKSINTGQTMDFSISARRDTGSVEESHLELAFYRRSTRGFEGSPIAEVVLGELTTSYQDFTGTWSVSSDQAFGTNELLVLKIILKNTGPPL